MTVEMGECCDWDLDASPKVTFRQIIGRTGAEGDCAQPHLR